MQPCTLPDGMAPAPRRMLITAWGLEIPLPSAMSWVGFIAGWIAVGFLVWVFNWIVGGAI
jgi:hypothetical protein